MIDFPINAIKGLINFTYKTYLFARQRSDFQIHTFDSNGKTYLRISNDDFKKIKNLSVVQKLSSSHLDNHFKNINNLLTKISTLDKPDPVTDIIFKILSDRIKEFQRNYKEDLQEIDKIRNICELYNDLFSTLNNRIYHDVKDIIYFVRIFNQFYVEYSSKKFKSKSKEKKYEDHNVIYFKRFQYFFKIFFEIYNYFQLDSLNLNFTIKNDFFHTYNYEFMSYMFTFVNQTVDAENVSVFISDYNKIKFFIKKIKIDCFVIPCTLVDFEKKYLHGESFIDIELDNRILVNLNLRDWYRTRNNLFFQVKPIYRKDFYKNFIVNHEESFYLPSILKWWRIRQFKKYFGAGSKLEPLNYREIRITRNIVIEEKIEYSKNKYSKHY